MKKKIIDSYVITPNRIFHYLQGNIRLFSEQYNLLPLHIKEQVLYRTKICKESCLQYGKCKYCGCDLPGKFYVTESCNRGEKFPDLMSEEEWSIYKEENDINLD